MQRSACVQRWTLRQIEARQPRIWAVASLGLLGTVGAGILMVIRVKTKTSFVRAPIREILVDG